MTLFYYKIIIKLNRAIIIKLKIKNINEKMRKIVINEI